MIEQILPLIGSYGFPIIACIFMARYVTSTQAKMTEAIAQLKDSVIAQTTQSQSLERVMLDVYNKERGL